MSDLPSTERVILGEVVGAHGLTGDVRVRVAGDSPDHILSVETLWMGRRVGDPEARRRTVRDRGMARPGEVRLNFEGIDRRDQVQPIMGLLLFVSADVLPDLPEDEFYWYELIGCQVESETGELVGDVREIWETGAHDVLVVQNEDGLRRLIPTARELMKEIDLKTRRIVVVDLPGLLEPA